MITQERWQRIKAIFQSAEECSPADRASLLNIACGDDESMRQEVETLLAAAETNEDFLGTPAYQLMAGVLDKEKTEFIAGQEVGPYTILSSLGIGGMGQVYLAQDSRLPRKVALKVLSAEIARDEQQVQRFEHEAQAASRLNHPNVCMIIEIGTTPDGRRFIAMEHIDGLTLRDLMERRRLAPAEALDVAIQVAAALAAAHAAGIVHRDIKPENIMLRPDGYVKVLDFGIAKLNESLPWSGYRQAASIATMSTEPGMLMGTVRYMSPEQLREMPVDQRTDIWSLGVVLHEMVTGSRPFEAVTSSDIIDLILGKQPTELKYGDELPLEFQQLIKRLLTKDRAGRYQTVKDLASDLKKLERSLARGSETGTLLVAQPDATLEPANGDERPIPIDPNQSTIFFRATSQAISTAGFLLSEIREHKTTAVFTGITAIFAVFLIAPNLPRLSTRISSVSESRQTPPAQMQQMEPFTNWGTTVCAAISPNGKSVAHVEKKDGMQQLLVTDVAHRGDAVVVAPDNVEYRGLTFSPDGNYLFFTTRRENSSGTLYRVALSGGLPSRIMDRVDSPISFSPSGDSFAFVRSNVAGGEYFLIIAGVDGTGERVIAKRENGDRLSVDGPAWSPDGKTIICGAGWWNTGYHMNLIEFDPANGQERVVGNQNWSSVYQVAWLEDSGALIISAREQPMSPSQLWKVSYPHGPTVRLTNHTADYRSVSFSRASNMIVSVQSQRITKIWTAPGGNARRAKVVTPVNGLAFGLDWMTNGKIVFSSMTGDHLNISRVDPDGSNEIRLTNEGDNYSPAISPDGRFIVFSSNRAGGFNIWRMNAEDGSDLKQLTFGGADSYPSYSPDSQWVFYDNQSGTKVTVWKVPIGGGEPVQLTDEYARMPVVSPDNQFMACRYSENGAQLKVALISLQDDMPVRLLPIPVMLFQKVQWTTNGRALTYIDIDKGVSNIWRYHLEDGSKQQLTNFHDDQIFAYAWSPDHKQLAVERGAEVNDVITIANQK